MANKYFGLGVETTYGTAVAPTRFLDLISEGIQFEENHDRIDTIRSYSTLQMPLLNGIVKGPAELAANYAGSGILFKYLIGSATTVTGTSNTHTFPATTGIDATDRIGLGLTVCVRRGAAHFFKYAGCKVIGLTHSMGTDAASRWTWNFLDKSQSYSTTGSDTTSGSYPTMLPVSPSHVSINFDGGASLVARNCQITVENPVDEFYVLGSTTIGAEPDRNGVLKVTGQAEVAFSTTTDYDKFIAGADVDVQIIATNTTQSLTYNMDKCRLLQATPHINARERLLATYQWEAFYNSDATENFQVVLVNGDATP